MNVDLNYAEAFATSAGFVQALLAALLWPTSTAILDFLYERVTFGNDTEAFLARLDVQWGAPYPLLLVVLFAAPLAAGKIAARRS